MIHVIFQDHLTPYKRGQSMNFCWFLRFMPQLLKNIPKVHEKLFTYPAPHSAMCDQCVSLFNGLVDLQGAGLNIDRLFWLDLAWKNVVPHVLEI